MKSMLKNLCAVTLAAGMSWGIATVSHAAWEGLNYTNDCNTAEGVPSAGAVLIQSGAADGTGYLKASDNQSDWTHFKGEGDILNIAFEEVFSGKEVSDFCTWETDVMFTADGAGFSIRDGSGARQGKVNTTIVYGNSAIRFSKKDGTKICDAKANMWYNIKLVGIYGLGQENAVMKLTVSEYAGDGSLSEVKTLVYPGAKYGEIMRNDKAPTRFAVNPGTCMDNISVKAMPPAAMEITPSAENGISMKAGEEKQFNIQLYADAEKTMKMPGANVVYELWNADKSDYLISDVITISPETGLLTVAGAAQSQSFVIRAKCVDCPEIYAEVSVSVEGVAMLEFVGAAFTDDTYTVLKQLDFIQNYANEGDITFMVAIHDKNGVLMDVFFKNVAYQDQTAGKMSVTLNETMPEGFDPASGDTMKVLIWSKTMGD